MKKKRSILALSVFLIVSLIFNYYLYKDNSSFKVRLGEEYQLATRYAIHYIDEPTFSIVLEELLNGNPSSFEHWSWELASINSTLNKTGNMHFKLVGDLINNLPKQVRVLTEKSSDEEKEMIQSRILFLNQILSKIEKELDEDRMLWYQEISNVNSKTSKYVEEQLKKVVNY